VLAAPIGPQERSEPHLSLPPTGALAAVPRFDYRETARPGKYAMPPTEDDVPMHPIPPASRAHDEVRRTTPAHNCTCIIDLAVLVKLMVVVARAIAQQDAAELRELIASRRAALADLVDAEPIRLDPPKLVTACADLAAVSRSKIAGTPEVRDLLEAARMMSTRERDVSRRAFESLLAWAARLRRLVELGAPDTILSSEVGLVSKALAAVDHFDFGRRSASVRDYPEIWKDEALIPAALAACCVPDARARDLGLCVGRSFVRGSELFPRPTDPASIPGWERFCGSGDYLSPPRLALGANISIAARRVIAFREWVEQDLTIERREKEMTLWGLESHLAGLNFAGRNGHAVVEWTRSDDDEGEFPEAPRSTAWPQDFPWFLEPAPAPPTTSRAKGGLRSRPGYARFRALMLFASFAFLAFSILTVHSRQTGFPINDPAFFRIWSLRAAKAEHEARNLDFARRLRADGMERLARGEYENALVRLEQAFRYDPETDITSPEIQRARHEIVENIAPDDDGTAFGREGPR
jgi:hypothetical protein